MSELKHELNLTYCLRRTYYSSARFSHPLKSDRHLNVVRGWQQLSKRLPALSLVVKVHTEEPPRAVREVERLSRNPENDWRTRMATGGRMEFPRHPENKKGSFVRMMYVDALTVKKRDNLNLMSDLAGSDIAWRRSHRWQSNTSGAEPSSDEQKELEKLAEDGIRHLRALSTRCLMMVVMVMIMMMMMRFS